jgi:hypothetical protein
MARPVPSTVVPAGSEIAPAETSVFRLVTGAPPIWVIAAVRAAWFPHDRVGISATVAYANLNGREGRVSNVLLLAGVETAVDLVPSARVFIPLRAEVGYLPLNGPVFRVTAGVAFQVARRVRIEVDLLSPTLWVLPESTPVSLDLGAFVHFGL